MPVTKKGPKGIVLPRSFFFLHKISMTPAIAPVKNVRYKATIIFGKPRIRPIKIAYLTSPHPIPLPRVKTRRSKKNANEPIAESKYGSICMFDNVKYAREKAVAARTILSGIIPYFKSIKKIATRDAVMTNK